MKAIWFYGIVFISVSLGSKWCRQAMHVPQQSMMSNSHKPMLLLSYIPLIKKRSCWLGLGPELCEDTFMVHAACFLQSWYGADAGFGAMWKLSLLSTWNAVELVQPPWVCDSVCVIVPLPFWAPDEDCTRVKPPAIYTKSYNSLLEVTDLSGKQHVYCKVSEFECLLP